MLIRAAVNSDCPQLAKLNNTVQAIHAAAEPLLFKVKPNIKQVEVFFKEMLADPQKRILILEDDNGTAAGYLFLEIMVRPENAFMKAYNMAYIHHLAVASEKQGVGYGTRLIEAACDLAKMENITRVALDSWSFNEDAHNFFHNRGFRTFNLRMSKIVG